jgi:SnoaL-like domain
VSETDDYVAIRRLQNAYADVVTRRAWAELPGLFVPDAPIEVDTRGGDPLSFAGGAALRDFISVAMARFEFFEFVILNTVIEIGIGGDADVAAGRMYMCELRTEVESGKWTNAFGVYHDRYCRRDDRWLFERRRYHSLARTHTDSPTEVFELPRLALDEL